MSQKKKAYSVTVVPPIVQGMLLGWPVETFTVRAESEERAQAIAQMMYDKRREEETNGQPLTTQM